MFQGSLPSVEILCRIQANYMAVGQHNILMLMVPIYRRPLLLVIDTGFKTF